MKSSIKILSELELFQSHLSPLLIENTRQFYCLKAKVFLERCTSEQLLINIKNMITFESQRNSFYFKEINDFFETSVKIVHEELLIKNARKILERGTEELFATANIGALEILYSLFSSMSQLGLLKTYFTDYFKVRETQTYCHK